MSAEARSNGWRGFEGLGERVERGQFGEPPERGGWLYRCDGMPRLMGCGEEIVVPRRWSKVGKKKSGWLVCYGLEPKPGTPGEFDDHDQWEEDHDVVLTFCPDCAATLVQRERTA